EVTGSTPVFSTALKVAFGAFFVLGIGWSTPHLGGVQAVTGSFRQLSTPVFSTALNVAFGWLFLSLWGSC
ncbi:MAG: hypothetical protein V4717_21960, partial [Bacteroidota bacterium]